jgi:uncharacterized membrane protein YbhN (UPF0104 family)
MKNKFRLNRQMVLRVAGSLLMVGALFFLFQQQGWDEIARAASQVTLLQFSLSLGLFLFSRLFIVGRWHVLLRSGGVRIPLLRSAELTFSGLFASNFLPTTIGGDLIRLAGIMKLGYDRAVSLASLAADRLVGMFGMVMVLPLGLVPIWQLDLAQSAMQSSPLQLTFLSTWLDRIRGFIKRTLQASTLWFRQPVALLLALACSWGHMLCTFGALFVLVHGLGAQTSFWLIAGLWSVVYFVTLIPVSINGYGVQELSMTYLFSHLGGLTISGSLILALLIRLVIMLASLPGALFVPSILAAARDVPIGE